MSIWLITMIGCGLALVVLVAVAVILWVIAQNDPDVVSGARQGWISRRSDKDDQGW